jgi:tetratricopeptide (TPR) repeat protein
VCTPQASTKLKADGNTLHNAQKYEEAAEKYEKAKTNVKDYTMPEALALRKACALNLSSCYLNLNQYAQCEAQSSEVISGQDRVSTQQQETGCF